jgi:hypothetical protein
VKECDFRGEPDPDGIAPVQRQFTSFTLSKILTKGILETGWLSGGFAQAAPHPL